MVIYQVRCLIIRRQMCSGMHCCISVGCKASFFWPHQKCNCFSRLFFRGQNRLSTRMSISSVINLLMVKIMVTLCKEVHKYVTYYNCSLPLLPNGLLFFAIRLSTEVLLELRIALTCLPFCHRNQPVAIQWFQSIWVFFYSGTPWLLINGTYHYTLIELLWFQKSSV